MNNNQASSLVRLILNFISGAVLAWSASKAKPAQDVAAYLVQFINGPDMLALASTGVMWLWGHITHKTSPPSAAGGTPKAGGVALLVALLAASFLFTGCVPLAAGSRPVVVRAEQSIEIANSTFDSAIHIDASNRAFFRTNAPAYHQFCEWLRVPVVIAPLTKPYPRGLAIVNSADMVKNSYKATNSTNDYAILIQSLAVVETVTSQAQQLITSATVK